MPRQISFTLIRCPYPRQPKPTAGSTYQTGFDCSDEWGHLYRAVSDERIGLVFETELRKAKCVQLYRIMSFKNKSFGFSFMPATFLKNLIVHKAMLAGKP